jgi:hypothetical protein
LRTELRLTPTVIDPPFAEDLGASVFARKAIEVEPNV